MVRINLIEFPDKARTIICVPPRNNIFFQLHQLQRDILFISCTFIYIKITILYFFYFKTFDDFRRVFEIILKKIPSECWSLDGFCSFNHLCKIFIFRYYSRMSLLLCKCLSSLLFVFRSFDIALIICINCTRLFQ